MSMDDNTFRAVLAIAVLVVGGGIIWKSFSVMKEKGQGFGPNNLRGVLLPLVVSVAAVLVIAGKADGSVAIGLLGTVAGYLFGISLREG